MTCSGGLDLQPPPAPETIGERPLRGERMVGVDRVRGRALRAGDIPRVAASRLGAPKAITATAHKLARLIYTMLKHGTAYVQQGMDEYEQLYRDRAVQSLTRRAKTFGYTLVQIPAGPLT